MCLPVSFQRRTRTGEDADSRRFPEYTSYYQSFRVSRFGATLGVACPAYDGNVIWAMPCDDDVIGLCQVNTPRFGVPVE